MDLADCSSKQKDKHNFAVKSTWPTIVLDHWFVPHNSLETTSVEMNFFVRRYGWSNFRNVASLISGVGIFCLGAGMSIYHGAMGLIHPQQAESLLWVRNPFACLTLNSLFRLFVISSCNYQHNLQLHMTLKYYCLWTNKYHPALGWPKVTLIGALHVSLN